nr:MAG TPA: hypothetical protein [Caudoviricetes sp.]
MRLRLRRKNNGKVDTIESNSRQVHGLHSRAVYRDSPLYLHRMPSV